MDLIIKNIAFLVQAGEKIPEVRFGKEMSELNIIENAFVWIQDSQIKAYGLMQNCPELKKEIEVIDATGKAVLPAFIDSHTHTVFAKFREEEFEMKLRGMSYEEIALRGGGILNSAEKLAICSEDELFDSSLKRIEKIIQSGTGALEIKSGYGLSVESELKMLRVIKRLKNTLPIEIKSTFLGAHAIPSKYKNNRSKYIHSIIHDMLPEIKQDGLADFIDVFCEKNYFTVSEMEQIVIAGNKLGLKAKLHLNQFNALGGILKAVELGALSVDHLEELTEEDIEALKKGNTMPVLLPGCSHFLGIPFGNARLLIENDLPLALASDFNPGSSPKYDLFQILSLACIKMKMLPNEAINALTINAAFAMGISNTHGRIRKGSKTPLILTSKIPSIAYLPYSFGERHVEKMINVSFLEN